jgi:hypothetical protein
VIESVEFGSMGGGATHLPSHPNINRKRDRHYDRNTDSQNEKPPEHPHNAFRIADEPQSKMFIPGAVGR